ncbi:type II secretion system F family protein [Evansella sp. AB-P1]|uniref:type II secretion system F family protein n=1 Tax=Evansella sp. AB-P1 TaxID=3037653 RepID=UPI00241E2CFE|nr:type II secretion system F family protein [Evansella sp. AB-P1]MDG5790064.1 type II secretion system F family protein [Evansella sp. AB-P1]
MLYITYFSTIALLILGSLLLRKEKQHQVNTRISAVFQQPVQGNGDTEWNKDEMRNLTFSKRIVVPAWKKIRRNFQKNMSNDKQEKLESMLLQAGNPLGMTAVEFRFAQIAFLIFLPLVAWGYASLLGIGVGRALFFAFFGFVIALLFPRFYIKQKIVVRNKQAVKELPDFLDLVTVSIEAGLGFDSALSKVVAKRDGVVSKEFQRSLEEIRLGKTRREALSGVRDRLQTDDIKTLIGSIIQAEQLGIGMVQILRVQSSELRQKRKQRAEEEAMKAPIKMLFPLVIFIFPCIFIVILGPAVIQILETF